VRKPSGMGGSRPGQGPGLGAESRSLGDRRPLWPACAAAKRSRSTWVPCNAAVPVGKMVAQISPCNKEALPKRRCRWCAPIRRRRHDPDPGQRSRRRSARRGAGGSLSSLNSAFASSSLFAAASTSVRVLAASSSASASRSILVQYALFIVRSYNACSFHSDASSRRGAAAEVGARGIRTTQGKRSRLRPHLRPCSCHLPGRPGAVPGRPLSSWYFETFR
jgi:hypothetical protein